MTGRPRLVGLRRAVLTARARRLARLTRDETQPSHVRERRLERLRRINVRLGTPPLRRIELVDAERRRREYEALLERINQPPDDRSRR